MEAITLKDINKLISVRPPYNSLEKITLDDNRLTAIAPVQQFTALEAQPITSAEAARHLAILGSIATAFINPKKERHYYLASNGKFRRLAKNESIAVESKFLPVEASAQITGKRSARALTRIFTPDFRPLIEFDVGYHMVPAKIFERGKTPQVTLEDISDPYNDQLELKELVIKERTLTATIGAVELQYCSGHFRNYPAMPIGFLMSSMVNAAGRLLRNMTGLANFQYLVQSAESHAEELGFVGEIVDLTIEFIPTDTATYHFHCEAKVRNSDKVIGILDLSLAALTPAMVREESREKALAAV